MVQETRNVIPVPDNRLNRERRADIPGQFCRVLTGGDPAWLAWLNGTRHDIFHRPEYVTFSAAHEGGEPAAIVAEVGSCRVLLPLVIRPIKLTIQTSVIGYRDALSPYGYAPPLITGSGPESALDPDDVRIALSSIIDHLRTMGIVSLFVRMNPLLDANLAVLRSFGEVVEHGESVAIDVSQSDANLLAQMRTSHRQDVHASERRGDRFYIDTTWERFNAFVDIYMQTMHRVKANPYYFFEPGLFRSLHTALPDHLHLSILEVDGEVASAGLVTEEAGITQCFLSGTHQRFLKQCPNKARLFHVSRWARERGNQFLHLGGGIGGGQDSLFDFKRGFSPLTRPFCTWRVVVNPEIYDQLVRDSSEEADGDSGTTGFFPAYARRQS